MRIAICSSIVPFVFGGGRNIVDWLALMLREAGHEVEVVYLPHVDSPELLFRQIAAYRWIDLTESADRVICIRPPAHFIRHPHKILWFIHHVRVLYDLWDSPYREFPDDPRHRGIRDALHAADTLALHEAERVFSLSHVVADRLRRFNGVESEVLYHPILAPETFRCEDGGDEIVSVCRMEHHKRQHLLLEALRHTRTPVRLRLHGAASDSAYSAQLETLIRQHGLQGRVVLEDRWISDSEKVDVLARSLAVAYVPVDEDSYGYPTVEAAHSYKPVITTSDSGGVLEFVVNGTNGLVADPDPRSVAEAMDRLYLDREATRLMGRNAKARVADLDITWSHVLERLLA
jgi:glycosyltransferase involved in cell wall biosynthesis